jgi:hypothetical protein
MDRSPPAGVSRRALLGAAGGIVVGAVLTRPAPARAADGDPLILGIENFGSGDVTSLKTDGPALSIVGNGDDNTLRVRNDQEDGSAISAEGGYTTLQVRDGKVGIDASGEVTGVSGYGQVTGVSGYGLTTGLRGFSPHRVGVRGEGGAVGLAGISAAGIGVKAQSGKAGVALNVRGRSQFSTAGSTTIAQGELSVTMTSPVPLSETSLILATPQSAGGVIGSASKNIAGGTFTLALVEPATRDVEVAWFVIG